jgi:DNA-directed RNA polymerase subunit beta
MPGAKPIPTRSGQPPEALRELLKDIYGENYAEQLDDRSDVELVELATNVRKGVPMGSPVFDGAVEADVTAMLRKAGLDESGQVTLFDGRTGEAFDRKVTVG